jgi:catechol 2,3-dioxygenase-like lactoylglutathione lyase family enzyme
MPSPIPGLHHVSAITFDPQRNLDFYPQVLGLRFVKRAVKPEIKKSLAPIAVASSSRFTGGLIGPPEAALSHTGDLAGTPVSSAPVIPTLTCLGLACSNPQKYLRPWARFSHIAAFYPGRPHTITDEEIDLAKRRIQGAFGNKAVA